MQYFGKDPQMGWYGYGFRPYVSKDQRLAKAKRVAASVAKKQKRELSPVRPAGRAITTTFWGQAWCDNLEKYSDFSNRLPRGKTYLRNGSVVDLVISPRKIEAVVAGSEPYRITIQIAALKKAAWNRLKKDNSAAIDSLLDLLAGRLSDGVMQRLSRPGDGLFPSPDEIDMKCSCPDYSYCCKHIAAVMYGVGTRLDQQPELLFTLREVDHQELISAAASDGSLSQSLSGKVDSSLAGVNLDEMFGIELDSSATEKSPSPRRAPRSAKAAPKRSTAKMVAAKASAIAIAEREMPRKSVKPPAGNMRRAAKKKKPKAKQPN